MSSRDGSNQEDLNPRGFCGVCWRIYDLVKEHVVLAPCAEQEERREPPNSQNRTSNLTLVKSYIYLYPASLPGELSKEGRRSHQR